MKNLEKKERQKIFLLRKIVTAILFVSVIFIEIYFGLSVIKGWSPDFTVSLIIMTVFFVLCLGTMILDQMCFIEIMKIKKNRQIKKMEKIMETIDSWDL